MVSARGRTQQVAFARRRGMSKRKACRLLHVARSTTSYKSKLDVKDALFGFGGVTFVGGVTSFAAVWAMWAMGLV